MENMALLEYTFLFDPVETWQHLYQFEESLASYLAKIGFEAQVVKSVDGGNGKRVMIIKKKQSIVVTGEDKLPVGRPKNMGNKIRSMAERKLRQPAIEFMRKK